jgi:hypothetical protein
MSTLFELFLGDYLFLAFKWGNEGEVGEKCTQKCAQSAYEKLAKVSKCQHLLENVLICIHLCLFV